METVGSLHKVDQEFHNLFCFLVGLGKVDPFLSKLIVLDCKELARFGQQLGELVHFEKKL